MKKIVAVLLAALFLSGCILSQTPMVNSTNVSDVDFSKSTNWKEGKACQMRVLLFPAFGLASVKLAAESAGIKKVKLVDYNYENYILLERACVIVFGD